MRAHGSENKTIAFWTYSNESANTLLDPKTGRPINLEGGKSSVLTPLSFILPLRQNKHCPIVVKNQTSTNQCRRHLAASLCIVKNDVKFTLKGKHITFLELYQFQKTEVPFLRVYTGLKKG